VSNDVKKSQSPLWTEGLSAI